MTITAELIERFFNNQCNAFEAEEVAEYLHQHPEIAEQYLTRSEWDNIQEATVDPSLREEMWTVIKQDTKPVAKRIQLYRKLAVAASILLLAGIGSFYYFRSTHKEEHNAVADNHAVRLKSVTNNKNTPLHISLQDGSTVTLESGSGITYYEPFGQTARNISLEGKAHFTVSKDKTKPFTVYSSGISTTALGTEFEVNTQTKDEISVKLFEGKVVVRSAHASTASIQDVYLVAGQQFTYHTTSKKVNVINMGASQGQEPDSAAKTKVKPATVSAELSFTNLPLDIVFKNLESEYGIVILYDPVLMSHKMFTGKFYKNQNPESVLKAIASKMRVKVTRKKGAFVVN